MDISNGYVATGARLAQGATEHCPYSLLHILPLSEALLFEKVTSAHMWTLRCLTNGSLAISETYLPLFSFTKRKRAECELIMDRTMIIYY